MTPKFLPVLLFLHRYEKNMFEKFLLIRWNIIEVMYSRVWRKSQKNSSTQKKEVISFTFKMLDYQKTLQTELGCLEKNITAKKYYTGIYWKLFFCCTDHRIKLWSASIKKKIQEGDSKVGFMLFYESIPLLHMLSEQCLQINFRLNTLA